MGRRSEFGRTSPKEFPWVRLGDHRRASATRQDRTPCRTSERDTRPWHRKALAVEVSERLSQIGQSPGVAPTQHEVLEVGKVRGSGGGWLDAGVQLGGSGINSCCVRGVACPFTSTANLASQPDLTAPVSVAIFRPPGDVRRTWRPERHFGAPGAKFDILALRAPISTKLCAIGAVHCEERGPLKGVVLGGESAVERGPARVAAQASLDRGLGEPFLCCSTSRCPAPPLSQPPR